MRYHLFALLCAFVISPALAVAQSGSLRGVWTVEMVESGTDSEFCNQAPPKTFPLTIEVRQLKSIGFVLSFAASPPSLRMVRATADGFEPVGNEPWEDFFAEWNGGSTSILLRVDRPSSDSPSFQSFGLTYEELANGRVDCRARYSGGPFTRISKTLPVSKACKKSCASKCAKKPKKQRSACILTCTDACMSR